MPEEELKKAFAQYQQDPSARFMVKVRRKRAEQLRSLLANIDTLTVDIFNREVWVIESATRLRDKDIKGTFLDKPLGMEQIAELDRALEAGELELHGNYIWRPASGIYNPHQHDAAKKLENIRHALRILNDPDLAPAEKVQRIDSISGFGPNTATGLVMVAHPTLFALYNTQSEGALRKLGFAADTLEAFEASAYRLKEQLGASDFIELDLFLYFVNQSTYDPSNTAPPAPRYWIEKTIVEGRSDRLDGEYALGRVLWSPQRAERGADIYRFMRAVRPGDIILHLTDNQAFTAISRVARAYEEFGGVPHTAWGENPSYIVRLRDFVRLNPPLSRSVFFAPPYRERLMQLIDAGARNLFYNRGASLNQGAYLTPAPAELVAILDDAYRGLSGQTITERLLTQRTWLFQANPRYFDLEAEVQKVQPGAEDSWTVTRYQGEMRSGHKVLLWQGGERAGIYAVGELSSEPHPHTWEGDRPPWVEARKGTPREEWRVVFRYSQILPAPLLKSTLLEHPVLRDMQILRAPIGTNFRITKEEWEILQGLLDRQPTGGMLDSDPPKVLPAPPTVDELGKLTNLSREELGEIESLLIQKRQLIFEGPPGSGKGRES